jgi:hypothetical protein
MCFPECSNFATLTAQNESIALSCTSLRCRRRCRDFSYRLVRRHMPTYIGSCHCGQVRFEVDAEIDHVRSCDCSVCSKRGALNFRVPKESLRLLTPWEGLSLYQWGSRTAKDYFCRTCGILPFRRPSDPTPQELREGVESFDGWAVNVRCLEGIDLSTLPVKQIYGSRIQW